MPEAFQPVDHLLVSRAESLAKESLKTVRQLPGMPSGLADAGALGVLDVPGVLGALVALGALEEAGAEADVLGTLGLEVGTGAVGEADVDGEDGAGAGRW